MKSGARNDDRRERAGHVGCAVRHGHDSGALEKNVARKAIATCTFRSATRSVRNAVAKVRSDVAGVTQCAREVTRAERSEVRDSRARCAASVRIHARGTSHRARFTREARGRSVEGTGGLSEITSRARARHAEGAWKPRVSHAKITSSGTHASREWLGDSRGFCVNRACLPRGSRAPFA